MNMLNKLGAGLALCLLAGCNDLPTEPYRTGEAPTRAYFETMPVSENVAYVSSLGYSSVSVIDIGSQAITGVPIPVNAASAVAATSDGHVYVTSQFDESVSVIDVTTNTLVHPAIPVGSGSVDLVITPDESKAYGASLFRSEVWVIDLATKTTLDPIEVQYGARDLAVTPDGARVYATNPGPAGNSVTAIDVATNTVIGAPIPVGRNPGGIAIAPNGARAYVTSTFFDNVWVIDVAANALISPPIPVGNGPGGIAITPDGARAYVANAFDRTVSVIDLALNAVIGSPITLGGNPGTIAITSDGTRAYVATSVGVEVVDLATNTVTGPAIPVQQPSDIVLTTVDVIVPPGLDPCTVNVTLTTQAEVDALDCTDVDGRLWIGPSADIINVDALSGLVLVRGALVVDGNDVLTNVDGLSSLTSARNVVFGGNPALRDVDGLSAMTTIGDLLLIGGGNGFTNLDGLSALTAVPTIEIQHSSLTRLSLPFLTSVDGLYLHSNQGLETIELPQLETVGFVFEMFDNDALTDLDLTTLRSVELFQINSNDALTNVDGFASLASAGFLIISYNTALEDVDGLSNLTQADAIWLQSNPALLNVDGLSGLQSLVDLNISDNATLAKCACGLYAVLPSVASIWFENNGSGCNSPADITAEACAECASMTIGEDLESLVNAGALMRSHGRALMNKIESAQKQASMGHFSVAASKIEAFVVQVMELEADGHIGSADAADLIDTADTLRDAYLAQVV